MRVSVWSLRFAGPNQAAPLQWGARKLTQLLAHRLQLGGRTHDGPGTGAGSPGPLMLMASWVGCPQKPPDQEDPDPSGPQASSGRAGARKSVFWGLAFPGPPPREGA